MERAVVVLCKIENCYDGNEGYENRKELLPLFFEKLDKIREDNNADKVILSLFTDDSWNKRASIITEMYMNISKYRNVIDINKQFYKDESHEVIDKSYVINKYEVENMNKQILKYIKELSENHELIKILCIDEKEFLDIPYSDNLISIGGLENIILSLNDYINSKNLKRMIYQNQNVS